MLVGLRVAPEGARTGYQRELFNHWVDADRDGCDAREEVLIAESRSMAQVDPYGCKVLEGDWYSLYDGLTFTDPAELDIDHMVPLAESWDSGAAGWDSGRRQAFANDLDHPQALRAVSASSNRSKSDLDPGQWKPTRDAAWCEYANDWVTVKKAWDLTADQNEVDDLRVMLRTLQPDGSPVRRAVDDGDHSQAGDDHDDGAAPRRRRDRRGGRPRSTARAKPSPSATAGRPSTDLTGWSIRRRGRSPHLPLPGRLHAGPRRIGEDPQRRPGRPRREGLDQARIPRQDGLVRTRTCGTTPARRSTWSYAGGSVISTKAACSIAQPGAI